MRKTPIIPNSQLMVLADDSNNAQKWQMTLFTESPIFLYIIMGSIVFILLILGIIILVKHRKEREKDLKQ